VAVFARLWSVWVWVRVSFTTEAVRSAILATAGLLVDIVTALTNSARLYIPERRKSFFKFWWNDELNLLKEASVDSNKLWQAAVKPRTGPTIYQQRQSCRLQYRKRIREERISEIELNNIDMAINFNKSSCMRIGLCFNSSFLGVLDGWRSWKEKGQFPG